MKNIRQKFVKKEPKNKQKPRKNPKKDVFRENKFLTFCFRKLRPKFGREKSVRTRRKKVELNFGGETKIRALLSMMSSKGLH